MATVKMVSGKPFIKGKAYATGADLQLRGLDVRSGTVETPTETLLFVTLNYKYHNELHADGIVHEPRNRSPLVDYGDIDPPPSKKLPKPFHLFVRHNRGGVFLYIGELAYSIRYDARRNKLFLKQ